MPKPITPAQKQQVLDLHAQGLARNEIARQLGIGSSSVSRVCKAAGLTFDRTQTAKATEAKVVDAKARRAELSLLLLEDAHKLRSQLWKPTTVFNFGGKDNDFNSREVPEPPFADKRNIMNAVATAVAKHESLVRMDADNGVADAESMLQKLIEGVGIPDE